MTEEIKTEAKEEIKTDIKQEEIKEDVSRETYSDRLASIKLEKKEQEDLRTRADALEQTIIATTETRENIRSYLDKMDHPKKQEYFEILDDIKRAGYNVKDENAHTNFIATKLFLTANEVPKSLKRDFEIIESSNALTPANLESLEKIIRALEKERKVIWLLKPDALLLLDKAKTKGDNKVVEEITDMLMDLEFSIAESKCNCHKGDSCW